MSKILDLVDALIGNVIAGNIYTDVADYRSIIRSPQIPGNILSGPPINVADTRPLNFHSPDVNTHAHPHNGLAGMNPKQHVFPASTLKPLHDAANSFINDPHASNDKTAVSSPLAKRTAIYNGTQPPFDVNGQLNNVSTPFNPLAQARASANSIDNQINNTSKPLETSINRDKIYAPQQPPKNIAGQVADTPSLNTTLSRAEIYSKSDSGGKKTYGPLSDLLDFHKEKELGRDLSHPHRDGTQRVIPTPNTPLQASSAKSQPSSVNTSGLAPSQHGRAPQDRAPGSMGDSEELSTWSNFGDGVTRNRIYNDRNNIPLTPTQQLGNKPDTGDLTQNLYDDRITAPFFQGGNYTRFPGYGGLRVNDIFVLSSWLRNVASEVTFAPKFQTDPVTKKSTFKLNDETIIKSTLFLANNFLLASLNKGDVQSYGPLNLVYNPLTFVSLPVRGVSPTERPTVGNIASTYKDNLYANDEINNRILALRRGTYVEVAPVHRLSKGQSPVAPPGYIGAINGPQMQVLGELPLNAALPTIIDLVTDGNTDQAYAASSVHTNIYNKERPYNSNNAVWPYNVVESEFNKRTSAGLESTDLKAKQMFYARKWSGAGQAFSGQDMSFPIKPNASFSTYKGFSSVGNPDNVDVAFNPSDEQLGYLDDILQSEYMPFAFQDLRDPDKILQFRAFLKQGTLKEIFTPEWTENRYFGRAENIPTYVGTSRIISFTFNVVAWSPTDLPVLYKKMARLQSMCYPSYDQESFLQAGPMIRLKIGDLISRTDGKGLAGKIDVLDISYEDGIWNVETDLKVPRSAVISLTFTVLHEANPGLYINTQGEKEFGTGIPVKQEDDSYKVEKIDIGSIRRIFGQVK